MWKVDKNFVIWPDLSLKIIHAICIMCTLILLNTLSVLQCTPVCFPTSVSFTQTTVYPYIIEECTRMRSVIIYDVLDVQSIPVYSIHK